MKVPARNLAYLFQNESRLQKQYQAGLSRISIHAKKYGQKKLLSARKHQNKILANTVCGGIRFDGRVVIKINISSIVNIGAERNVGFGADSEFDKTV